MEREADLYPTMTLFVNNFTAIGVIHLMPYNQQSSGYPLCQHWLKIQVYLLYYLNLMSRSIQ